MTDRLREFIEDLRLHWDDHYWWARHPMLQAALLAVVAGAVSLLFTILETRVKLRARAVEVTG